jgi:hypothetical protein
MIYKKSAVQIRLSYFSSSLPGRGGTLMRSEISLKLSGLKCALNFMSEIVRGLYGTKYISDQNFYCNQVHTFEKK